MASEFEAFGRKIFSQCPCINQPSPTISPDSESTLFVIGIAKFDIPFYEFLYSCLPYLQGVRKIYVGPFLLDSSTSWKQWLAFKTRELMSGERLLQELKTVCFDKNWTYPFCRVHFVHPKYVKKCRQEFSIRLQSQIIPKSNEEVTICHFFTFGETLKLFEWLLEPEIKKKKEPKKPRNFMFVAESLLVLYEYFARFIHKSLIYFYNFQSCLWVKNQSMDNSVMFLIHLCRKFLTESFHCYQKGMLHHCHPDSDDEITRRKGLIEAAARFVVDFGNHTDQNKLQKQLEKCITLRNSDHPEDGSVFGKVDEWLPFRNGLDINIFTLDIRQRTQHHYQVVACTIDWEEPTPDLVEFVENFMLTIASGHEERVRELLLQAFIIFSGDNHNYVFFNIGQTANSKSTLTGLYAKILGDFAYRCPKTTLFQTKGSKSGHTGFLSSLEHRRLILFDDSFSAKDSIDIPLIKTVTTTGSVTDTRDPYSKEIRPIIVRGIILFCLNPEDIPQGFTNEQAQARRLRVFPFQTRYLSRVDFENLKPTDQTSGLYAISDDELLDYMGTSALLQALTYLILTKGGEEYRRRCANKGEPFLLKEDLNALYFGSDHADFQKWWTRKFYSSSNTQISIRSITALYNDDHLENPFSEEEILSRISKLHPPVNVGKREVNGNSLSCAIDIEHIPSSFLSPGASSSSSFSPPLPPDLPSARTAFPGASSSSSFSPPLPPDLPSARTSLSSGPSVSPVQASVRPPVRLRVQPPVLPPVQPPVQPPVRPVLSLVVSHAPVVPVFPRGVTDPDEPSTKEPGPPSSRLSRQISPQVPVSPRIPVPSSSRGPVPSSSRIPVPSSSRIPVPSSSRIPVPSSSRIPVPSSSRGPVPSSSSSQIPIQPALPATYSRPNIPALPPLYTPSLETSEDFVEKLEKLDLQAGKQNYPPPPSSSSSTIEEKARNSPPTSSPSLRFSMSPREFKSHSKSPIHQVNFFAPEEDDDKNFFFSTSDYSGYAASSSGSFPPKRRSPAHDLAERTKSPNHHDLEYIRQLQEENEALREALNRSLADQDASFFSNGAASSSGSSSSTSYRYLGQDLDPTSFVERTQSQRLQELQKEKSSLREARDSSLADYSLRNDLVIEYDEDLAIASSLLGSSGSNDEW